MQLPKRYYSSCDGGTTTPFRFVGTKGYHADSSGKTYVRARVLEPEKGRWLTEDPIGFAGGDWNLYAYVRNNLPVGVDQTGLSPIITIPACPPPVIAVCKAERALIDPGKFAYQGCITTIELGPPPHVHYYCLWRRRHRGTGGRIKKFPPALAVVGKWANCVLDCLNVVSDGSSPGTGDAMMVLACIFFRCGFAPTVGGGGGLPDPPEVPGPVAASGPCQSFVG